MSFSGNCHCGPVSAGRGLKQLMLESVHYVGEKREPANIKEARHPALALMDDCWEDCRMAVKGSKAIKEDARERGWLELPQHISWVAEHGSKKQKDAAQIAAHAYFERAHYDGSVRRGIKTVVGSVMRKDVAVSGVSEGNDSAAGRITMGDLDRADERGRTLQQFAEFILDEKATTRYTAIYTRTVEFDGRDVGSWKVYTAENIWNPLWIGGRLVHIVFREHEVLESTNRFMRHKTQEIFRELSIEKVGDADGERVIERIWRPVRDAKGKAKPGEYTVSDDIIVMVRERNLTEIPVVIDGGPLPGQPMFEEMCDKSKELFGLSAKIKYRLHRIAHPTPHLNYEDEPSKSFIVTGARAPKAPNRPSNADAAKDAVKKAAQNSSETKKAMVSGQMLQTQKATFKYIYDTGEGLDHLFRAEENCKKDIEAIGGDYGLTVNNSNIAEGTERLRTGKDTAFVIAHIASSSEALTQAARWLAVFNGVTSDQAIREINLEYNLCLNDEGPSFTHTDILGYLREGGLPRIIIIRMARCLLPTKVIPEDVTDEQILDMLIREENGAIFGTEDVDDMTANDAIESILGTDRDFAPPSIASAGES